MKIILVTERLNGHGGWYTYARLLCDGLRQNGHTVMVITERGADGDAAILPSPLETLGKPWLLPGAARRLKESAKAFSPDVIHVTVEPYALVCALLPERYRNKTVLTIHGSYGIRPLENARSRPLACRAYKRFAQFITVSEYTKNAVSGMLKERCRGETCENFAHHVTVIRNGIVLPASKPAKTTTGVHRILLVGGVKPRKGILEAVDACAAYRHSYGPDFMFTIAGTCEDKESYVQSVRARIKEHGLTENVQLTGSVSDEELAALYANADLYLMPSATGKNTFEGYGIAFIEAAAYGIPSIGPGESGAAEAIKEGVTGYRLNVADPESISEHMHRILDEHVIKSDDCRAWAEQHRIEDRVKEIENVYDIIHEASSTEANR